MSAVPAPSDADEFDLGPRVAGVLATLEAAGLTVAAAESLTGGLLTGALTSVAGSSAVVRGGVIVYATDLKGVLLGVDARLLDEAGPVDERVARQMACGVRTRLGATHGVATTGEAGPESASGQPVGTVHVAVCGPEGTRSRALHLGGDRAAVRRGAVVAAVDLLAEVLGAR